jgi:hypothetical protein
VWPQQQRTTHVCTDRWYKQRSCELQQPHGAYNTEAHAYHGCCSDDSFAGNEATASFQCMLVQLALLTLDSRLLKLGLRVCLGDMAGAVQGSRLLFES